MSDKLSVANAAKFEAQVSSAHDILRHGHTVVLY